MSQVLEEPFNGVVVDGGLPATSVFAFAAARNVKRVGVLLDPRIVMPVGTSAIPAGVQATLTGIADAAQAAGCQVAWAMQGCLEPVSDTVSRRPTVGWLSTFWGQVDALLGDHPATWSLSLLTAPTVAETVAANNDPDPAVSTWAAMSWSPDENPALSAGPWLEALTAEVVADLRAAGCTSRVTVPMIFAPDPAAAHPGGPWVDDDLVWYGAAVSPMGADGVHTTKGYDAYLADAAELDDLYRESWVESVYATQTPGHVSVVDALDLFPPDLRAIPPATEVIPSLPVTALVASPLNGGALVSWTAPTDFGTGDFMTYRVASGATVWESTLTAVEIELANGVEHVVTVTVVTVGAESSRVTVNVTPSSGSPSAAGPWLPPVGSQADVDAPIPQPLMFAFPSARNFRPGNFMKTPDEVPEGL